MARKNNVEEIDLKITQVIAYGNGLRILWNSQIGEGCYDIIFNSDGTIEADSETMDSNEDKDFLKKLMSLLIEQINVK